MAKLNKQDFLIHDIGSQGIGPGKSPQNEIVQIEDTIGSTIVDIGMVPNYKKEGGLAIDYAKDGVIKRIIFGFTELGIWVDKVEILKEKK
jgi:hypothetical protein